MKKTAVKILSALLMLSMVFSTNVFAANDETTSAWDSFLGLFGGTATSSAPVVQYRAHIQDLGNMPKPDGTYVTGPTEMGTRGQFLRMEGFWLKSSGLPAGVHLTYQVHVQNEGWMNWVGDDQFAGTEGKMQRIEAIKIKLVDAQGNPATGYSVQYKGHVQDKGDLPANDPAYTGTTGWYADGQQLGTTGSSLRLEALSVQIVATTPQTDMTAYNAAVAKAVAVDEADYTAASYAALEKALVDNLVTADNTQAEVDAATAAINAAYDALVKVAEIKIVSSSAIDTTGTVVALNGATVARNVSFEVKFSTALEAATVNTNTVKLYNGTELVAIDAPQSVNDTVKFKALSVLVADADYTLVVEGVTGTNSAKIAKTTVASFSAADTTVVKKIDVLGLSGGGTAALYNTASADASPVTPVANNWVYGAAGSSIVVTFDEAVDKASLSSSTLKLVEVATGKTFAMDYNSNSTNKTVTLTIVDSTKYLTPKSEYQLVFNGVKALNGTAVDPFAFNFVYQASKPATIINANIKTADGTALPAVQTLINPKTTALMFDDGTTYRLGCKFVIDYGVANPKLDTTTVTSDFFKIREKDSQVEVPATVTFNSGANTVEIAPKSDLKDEVEYEIFVSPFIKNTYGVTAGTKNSDAAKVAFTTVDVTAPKVVSVKSSTESFTDLAIDKPVTLYVEMSEKIVLPTIYNLTTGTPVGFASASGATTGNIMISRTDDETIGLNSAAGAGVNVQKVQLSADQKTIEITVDPTLAGTVSGKNAVQGKSFRVTLAGYTPSRANNSLRAIVDRSAFVANTLDQDSTFTMTFAGDDTTAPKVTGTRAYVSTSDYTALDGATNVNGKIQLILDDKLANIDQTLPAAPVVTLTNSAGTWTVDAIGVTYTEIGGKAVVQIAQNAGLTNAAAATSTINATEGTASIRVTGVKDLSGNESSTYKADFVVGVGANVNSLVIVQKTAGAYSSTITDIAQAGVQVNFNEAMNRASITTGTVKLYDGTTLMDAAIDYDELTASNFVVLKPSTQLVANKTYTVVVSADVKDNAGNKLQQTGAIAKPADASLNIATGNSGAPVISGSAVVDATKRTITFTFDQKIWNGTGNTLVLTSVTDPTDQATVAASEIKYDDKTATATVFSGLKANTQYTGTFAVASDVSHLKTTVVPVTVQTTTAWKNDVVRARPLVPVGGFTATGSTFTLNFSEEVKIDDVKAALKVYNATDAKDVSLFSSSYTITNLLAADNDYAKTFKVTIPGYAAKDYYVSFAKETIKDYAGFTNKDAQDFAFSTAPVSGLSATIAPSASTTTVGDTTLTVTGLTGTKLWLNSVADAAGTAPVAGSARVAGTYNTDITTTADHTLSAGTFDVVEVDAADKVIGFGTVTITAAQLGAYAAAPTPVALAVGSTLPATITTQVAIPAAGATDTTGVVDYTAGTATKIKFNVTDTTGTSSIKIAGANYTSGNDYTLTATGTLTVVVTTTEAGKVAAVRTFDITVN